GLAGQKRVDGSKSGYGLDVIHQSGLCGLGSGQPGVTLFTAGLKRQNGVELPIPSDKSSFPTPKWRGLEMILYPHSMTGKPILYQLRPSSNF
ncbi:hypothetical protein TorRG33x02_032090, partial [Trema orientale]